MKLKSQKNNLSQLQASNYSIQNKLNKLETENQSLLNKLNLSNDSSKSKDIEIDKLNQHISEIENKLHSNEIKLSSANQDLSES